MKCVISKIFVVTMLLSVIAISPVISQHHHTTKSDAETEKERLEALYWSRIEAAKMNFVQADVDFMTHMIPHHAQALIMSRLAPTNNASPVVQTLAARIINAQQDEIVTMQRWLRDRKQPVPIINLDGLIITVTTELPDNDDDHDMGSMSDMEKKPEMDHSSMNHNSSADTSKMKSMDHSKMDHSKMKHDEPIEKKTDRTEVEMDHSNMDHSTMDHGGMDHSDMPGMLTQDELNHLARLTGSEFDQAFLTYMIGHHQGAIIMVNDMFAADGSGNDEDAYRLAADIYAEQLTEIERMKLMLNEMAAAPMPSQQHKH
ncbi:MAG TPA: hypothetical protein DCE78_00310 [Bacteroidetes bacterium]|nr:hypothetical protein [Bacteroidota bacterium]